jgi:hypothetical protein
MKDTQSLRDERGIAIDLAGVNGVRWLAFAEGEWQR